MKLTAILTLLFVFSANATELSGKQYRCVADDTNEVLDESLEQLPGDHLLDLVFNEYPKSSYLVPVNNSEPIQGFDFDGFIEFENEGEVVDKNGTTFSISLEALNFGGNFKDTLRVVITNESEQEESVNTFLCEPYK